MEEREIIKSESSSFAGKVMICISLLFLAFGFMGPLGPLYPVLIGIVIFITGIIIFIYTSKSNLIVTNKRVYGTDRLGKRVDLPMDSISVVATSMFNGITVATSSGKIQFVGIKNRDKIHSEISKIIINRQDNKVVHETLQSNADELKKYNELYQQGIITEDEYNAKKKQLLGL